MHFGRSGARRSGADTGIPKTAVFVPTDLPTWLDGKTKLFDTDGDYESVEDSLDESDLTLELEASRLASDYFSAPSRFLNVL
jgi:hypothetical protein